MSNGTYYAVYGKDAFGVYTNVSWAKNIASYIRNPEIVKCSSLGQAFCMARDNYNDYQMGTGVDCFLQDLFGKKCRTFWRILHLQIGENCRGTGRSFFTDRVPVQA